MRLFVAIEAPTPWLEAALEARRALERALGPDQASALRWVAPDRLHVTLAFLGEIDASRLPSLQQALDAAAPAAPLTLHTGAPALFGRPDRARVVWLSLAGDTVALEDLAARVERDARASLGLEPPRHAPMPHLTLARVRERATRDTRRALARAVQDAAAALAPSAPVLVRRITLVRSHLDPRGPRYEVLSEHPGSTDDRDTGREVDEPHSGA